MVEEKVFLLHAFLLGVRVCFIYDWLRILRRAIPHGDGTVALEDILFWIYCGAEVFLLMQRESDGSMRWFAMLGAFAGMLLYRRIISPWFVKYLSRALRKIIGWITPSAVFEAGAFQACEKGKNKVDVLSENA